MCLQNDLSKGRYRRLHLSSPFRLQEDDVRGRAPVRKPNPNGRLRSHKLHKDEAAPAWAVGSSVPFRSGLGALPPPARLSFNP